MAGVDGGGAALVAAVGLLGAALLVLGRRLRAARASLARVERRATLARRAAEAEAALVAPVLAAGRAVGDLTEVRDAVRAMLARAEAARALYAADTAA